ncbi:hypothetical protein B0H11DRAFT_1984182 [Mycena galericulata]|nr:hypothetical protein B0H11DRAFT_1984182 [Mycena galericulata]
MDRHLSQLNIADDDVDLPVELWQEILALLGRSDVCAVALVSPRLKVIAQPLIFRSCVFRMRRHRRARALLRLGSRIEFLTSPDIAPLVQEYTVLDGRHNSADCIAAICDSIQRFPNLRNVNFKYVRMNSSTISAICQASAAFKTFLSLSLVGCMTDFTWSDGQPSSINLSAFTLHNGHTPHHPHDNRWLLFLSFDALRVLDVATPQSTASFLAGIMAGMGTRFSSVETIHFHLHGLEDLPEGQGLVSILTSFPSVRILQIHPPHKYEHGRRVHSPPALSESSLTRLSSFHGPASHAAVYCRARASVNHLKLYGLGDNYACTYRELLVPLQTIASSTPSPDHASLELRIAFPVEDIAGEIAATFPALRSLRVVAPYSDPFQDFHRLITSLEALVLPPRVAVLYLAFRYCIDIEKWAHPSARFERMKAAVRALAQRYPTLRHVCHVCVCCDLAHWAYPHRTRVWRWTRGAHPGEDSMTAAKFIGSECLDVPAPRRGRNEVVTEGTRGAAAVEDDRIYATRAHRELSHE